MSYSERDDTFMKGTKKINKTDYPIVQFGNRLIFIKHKKNIIP